MKKMALAESRYNVRKGKILRTKQMTAYEKLFEVALEGAERLDHEPGQFIMLSLCGVGESPYPYLLLRQISAALLRYA